LKKIDSLLFDLDGTLWDSRQALADARNHCARKMGLNLPVFTAGDIQKTMGLTRDQIYAKIFAPHITRPQFEEMRGAMDAALAANVKAGGASLYPEVRETLERLAERAPLYLVSNCGKNYLRDFFAWSGLRPLFRDTLCFGDTLEPKAKNIRAIVIKHRLRRPVYVGDTITDQSSAREAGVPYLHADYGFGEPEGACRRIKHFSELLSVL
jgi:phosphoglycolate phosphatase